jgi:PST family polysaccharide transporter
MKVSAIYFISTFATTAYGITNTFIFGIMNLPPSQIAYWGVSFTLISAAQSLYSPIISSLYPHMAARKDFQLLKRIIIILVPINIILVVFLFKFTYPIIMIISGLEYVDAVQVFRLLLPVLVFSFPAMLIGFPLLGIIGRVKELTTTTIISAVFHILGLLFLILIEKFNVFNVAILRSLTEFVLLCTRMYLIIKYIMKKV